MSGAVGIPSQAENLGTTYMKGSGFQPVRVGALREVSPLMPVMVCDVQRVEGGTLTKTPTEPWGNDIHLSL